MGADLLIAGMAAPHRDGILPWEIDAAEAERIGHERIDGFALDAWTDDDLDTLALNLGLRAWEREEGEGEPADPATVRAELVSDLRAELHAALTALFGYRRDVTSIQFGERLYWLTGGMSWGDTPTDAYEWVAALDWIGVYDDPLP